MRALSPTQTIALLAGVFLAPLLLAWSLYLKPDWQPPARLQHGQLLRNMTLPVAPGEQLDSRLRGYWTLLYLQQGPCRDRCRAQLNLLERIRVAQGEAKRRVQRVLLQSGGARLQVSRQVAEGSLIRVSGDVADAGAVYLLDPEGRPVLRYPPGFEPMGLVKDLQHLLRMAGVQ